MENNLFLKEEQVTKLVSDISEQVKADLNDNTIFICVLNGAMFFFTDLIRKIDNFTIEADTVCCKSYTSNFENTDPNIIKDITVDIKGKDIILVEDIVDTGNTITYLKEFFSKKEPSSIKVCSLIKRESCKIDIDYIGIEAKDDLWLYGYGLDDNEKYRNLKDIKVISKNG